MLRNQENLIAQFKDGGVRALHAPLNTLDANWALYGEYGAGVVWSLKAWMALSVPIVARWRKKHIAQRDRWLRMAGGRTRVPPPDDTTARPGAPRTPTGGARSAPRRRAAPGR